jgi:hypothetical protein
MFKTLNWVLPKDVIWIFPINSNFWTFYDRIFHQMIWEHAEETICFGHVMIVYYVERLFHLIFQLSLKSKKNETSEKRIVASNLLNKEDDWTLIIINLLFLYSRNQK